MEFEAHISALSSLASASGSMFSSESLPSLSVCAYVTVCKIAWQLSSTSAAAVTEAGGPCACSFIFDHHSLNPVYMWGWGQIILFIPHAAVGYWIGHTFPRATPMQPRSLDTYAHAQISLFAREFLRINDGKLVSDCSHTHTKKMNNEMRKLCQTKWMSQTINKQSIVYWTLLLSPCSPCTCTVTQDVKYISIVTSLTREPDSFLWSLCTRK